MKQQAFRRWLTAAAITVSNLPWVVARAEVSADQLANIQKALPPEPVAKPAKARKLLVYSRTRGFRHSSIPVGHEAMKLLGEKTGAWTATGTEDPAFFEPAKLKEFDAVLMLNTTGPCFTTDEKEWQNNPARDELRKADSARAGRLMASLLEFVENGGGLAGIHAATDTLGDDPRYFNLIGGTFNGHPWNSGDTVTVKVRDVDHPLTAPFKAGGPTFDVKDEIYQLKNYDAATRHNLLGLYLGDGSKTNMKKGGINRTDGDFAISWVRQQGKGRVFYCSLGHNEHIYWTPEILKFYLGGLQFALGDHPVSVKNGSTKP
jgi:type 1 glutamine amidotransferase